MKLNMQFKFSSPKLAVMYDVLFVPSMACNLFSARAAAQRGNVVKFGHSRCWIRGRSGSLLHTGSLSGKLCHLDCEPVTSVAEQTTAACKQPSADCWHQRLGHVNEKYLTELSKMDWLLEQNCSRKQNLSFARGVWKKKCIVNHLNQWRPLLNS